MTAATGVALASQRSRARLQIALPDLNRAWLAVVLLLGECGFLFFYGLSAGELYRTETLRAIIAAEFLRSGDWAVPTLYGEPLFTKPPGMYAAIALLSLPAGKVTELSARLPSAISATVTVLLFFWYFRRHFGNRNALLAAVFVPLSFMWLDKGPSAEIDMLQTAWVSAAILFFLRAMEIEEEVRDEGRQAGGSSPRPSVALWWIASMLCVAGGVLTKWTAPVFFYAAAVPYLWWWRRLRCLLAARHLQALALAAILCVCWAALAIHRAGWHVWFDTVSREAMIRLLPSHHPKPYAWQESLFHPFKLLAMNFPWSFLALYALNPGFWSVWKEKQRRVLLGFHCWVWPNLLFWSLIPEHAFRHSFPLFPGISGLAGMVSIAWFNGWLRRPIWPYYLGTWLPHLRPRSFLFGVLVFWIAFKLVFVHVVVPRRNEDRQTRAKGEMIAARVPPGSDLYVGGLKDEGLMFYYGRPVRRVAALDQLPSSALPAYCILDQREWSGWCCPERITALERLEDAQGAPIVLIRLLPPFSRVP